MFILGLLAVIAMIYIFPAIDRFNAPYEEKRRKEKEKQQMLSEIDRSIKRHRR